MYYSVDMYKALLITSLLFMMGIMVSAQCQGCTDSTFLVANFNVKNQCPTAINTLNAALNASTGPSGLDSAWETFCTSRCYTSLASIHPALQCCVEAQGYGAMQQTYLQFCKVSQQSPTRRCGTEIRNIDLVACSATNANDCTNLGTCEWTQGMCLYKPQQSSLELICSDCNRAYFANFPTGGVNSMDSYSKIAPVFDFACNKIDDQYCLLTAAARGYNSAGALNSSDLTAYCSNPNATAKRCFRALTATTAKSLVHSARVALLTCNTSTCQADFSKSLTLAAALEASAATMCSSNGTINCFGLGGAAMTDSCFSNTVTTSSCAGCDTSTISVASSLGCCSLVFSTSGALVAAAAPAGRLLLASIAADSTNINKSIAYLRTPLTGVELTGHLSAAKVNASIDTFTGVATCTDFAAGYDELVGSAGLCTVRPYSRTYTFGLQLNYAAYTTCPNADVVKNALIADIIPKLGITSAQILSTSVSTHSNGMALIIRFATDTADEITSIDSTIGTMSFPLLTAGREIAFECPSVFRVGVYTQIVKSATPTFASQDVALSTASTAQTSPQIRTSSNGSSGILGNIGISVLAVVLVAMMASL